MTPKTLLPLTIACCLLVGPPSAEAARCDTDVVPAATLLVPYFEVDLTDPEGATTLFSLVNRDREPVLANVVLWTDWAVPTLSFQVYLAGHDIQTVNLRDVLRFGRVPATGSAVSPHGSLSAPPVELPGCNPGTEPGAAPVYSDPAFTEAELDRVRAWHTGECFEDRTAGDRAPNGLAHGYVTVDTVRRCSPLTPADAGYFGPDGVADDRNALLGDYYLVDPSEDFAQGEPAVHIEAFPGEFSPGDYTFYRRYVDGSASDAREPLGTQYSVRHILGAGFDAGTRLLVWRDTGSADAEPRDRCGLPSWYGAGGLETYRVFINEEGESFAVRDFCDVSTICFYPIRYATQAVEVAQFGLADLGLGLGSTYLALWRANHPDPAEWEVLQGWVSAISSAEQRYSVGQRAFRLDSACDPGPLEPPPPDFR